MRWLRAKRRREEAQTEEQTTLADDPALRSESISQQLVRELMFYEDINDELLRYAEAQDVKMWLDRRKQEQVKVFRRRYKSIRRMDIAARSMWHLRELTASMIRFYARRYPLHAQTRGGEDEDDAQAEMQDAVSYTHLTLPTICSV